MYNSAAAYTCNRLTRVNIYQGCSETAVEFTICFTPPFSFSTCPFLSMLLFTLFYPFPLLLSPPILLLNVSFFLHAHSTTYVTNIFLVLCIGYTPRARLLSDLATEYHRHKVAKSLGYGYTLFKNQVDK